MRILREKRKMSRVQAIIWGLKSRAASSGLLASMAKTASILAIDSFRAAVFTALKICFVYPLRLLRKAVDLLAMLLTGKKAATTTTTAE